MGIVSAEEYRDARSCARRSGSGQQGAASGGRGRTKRAKVRKTWGKQAKNKGKTGIRGLTLGDGDGLSYYSGDPLGRLLSVGYDHLVGFTVWGCTV